MIIEPKYELVIRDVEIVRRDKEGKYLIQQSYLNKLNELKNAYQGVSSEDKRKINIILPDKVEIEEFIPPQLEETKKEIPIKGNDPCPSN